MLSGIFVLPGLAYSMTGPSAWLAFLVAGVSVLPAAMSKAELATAMPASGGTYIYLNRAFGPLAGTISGLGLWMSLLLKSAFALVGFAAYLWVVAPHVNIKLAALSLLVGITLLNIMGVSKVSKAQLVVVSISIAGLAGLMVMSGHFQQAEYVADPFRLGAGGFFAAAGFVFMSYSGVTKVAAMAEEIKNPERNLPLAMFIALFIAAVLYGSVTYILVAVVPPEDLAGSPNPIYSLAFIVGGETIANAAVGLAILTMTAMAAAGLLASSRFPFAMSRDKLLPDSLSDINQKFKTPVVGILVTATVMALAILFLDIGPIAKLASAFKIIIFMAVNLALIVLRESRVEWYKPRYRSPWYPWVQIFGLVTEFALLLTLGVGPTVAVLAIVVLGAGIFYFYGARRTPHRGVMPRLRNRRELIEEAYKPDTLELRRVAAEETPDVLVAVDASVRSPEMLAEVGIALSGGHVVRALHVTEVPEQILELDAYEEELAVTSLRRRIEAMGAERSHEVVFDAVVTHDRTATVHRAASESGPEWTVLEWSGRRRRDLLLRNPQQWLHRHLPCNVALYHDYGVRYIREILVYPEPGPDDALVLQTAEHLAETYNASLTFARFVTTSATDASLQSERRYLDQVRELCTRPSDVRIIRGKRFEDAMAATSAGYDLLVMGSPSERGLSAMLGTAKDILTEMAGCSVLRLSTPHDAVHTPLDISTSHSQFDLMSALNHGCVQLKANLDTKTQAFATFADAFGSDLKMNADSISSALWTRERTQNTSVGYGVALPHATMPGLESTQLGIFTLDSAMDYQAIDGAPVDVFIVSLGPPKDRRSHLLLLATISKLILHTDLLQDLRSASSAADVENALKTGLSVLDGG